MESAESTTGAIHPFNAAFGPGRFSVFAIIDLASLQLWTDQPMVAERMERSAREYARLMHVSLGHCGCCHRATDHHVLGEIEDGDPRAARRFVVCRTCIDRHCGIATKRKLSHLDKTRAAYIRQLEVKPPLRRCD